MDMPNFSLEGKVAIVTGGRRGIGKAIALTFASAGADVAICDNVIDTGELKAVAAEINKLGRCSLATHTDISEKTEVDNMVQKVIDEFGTIDILVNNAVISIAEPVIKHSEEEWNTVTNTDLKGYFLCSQAVSRWMIEQKRGNIISMASTGGMRAATGGAYSIAKAGVIMLTRVLAKQLASYNIRVNAIAPCVVKTELTRYIWSDPDSLKQTTAEIPLGRIATTTDIVGPALFLASEASGFITGHTILVDGGMLA